MADGHQDPPGRPAPPPSGWYPDPWYAGQHRFWAGRKWTADVFPDGPSESGVTPAVRPRPVHEAPPAPPPTEHHPEPPPPPTWGRRGVAPPPALPLMETLESPVAPGGGWRLPPTLVRNAALVLVGALIGALVVYAVDSRRTSSPTTLDQFTSPQTPLPPSPPPVTPGQSTPTPGNPGTTPPPGVGGAPNSASSLLAGLVVRPTDVPPSTIVVVIPGGDLVQGQVTLDLCNATYTTESMRVARLQDQALDPLLRPTISTEAVLYSSPAATAKAFAELSAAASACPARPVTSPVGEPTVTTRFNPRPDRNWPTTPGVQRLAFDLTATSLSGQEQRSIVVYLRRGRVLEGIYLPQTAGVRPSVEGRTTAASIVQVFAERIAALPAAAVR